MSEQQQGAAGDLLSLDLDELVAATDRTILALLAEWEEPITAPMYEQIRYHLGYADPAARPGQRMRPLLGLLAYASISPDWDRALPGAAAVELGQSVECARGGGESDGQRGSTDSLATHVQCAAIERDGSATSTDTTHECDGAGNGTPSDFKLTASCGRKSGGARTRIRESS